MKHKENGPQPTTRVQCRLIGANDCKCSREQFDSLTCLPKRRRVRHNKFLAPSCLTNIIQLPLSYAKRTDRRAIELVAYFVRLIVTGQKNLQKNTCFEGVHVLPTCGTLYLYHISEWKKIWNVDFYFVFSILLLNGFDIWKYSYINKCCLL
jgi:hypothetical protein